MRIRSRSPYDNSTYELSPPQGAAPIRLNRNAGERSSIKKKRERHCHPTARAPYDNSVYELSSPEAASIR